LFVPLSLAEPTERSRPHLEWGTAGLHRQLPCWTAADPPPVFGGRGTSEMLSDRTLRTFQLHWCDPSVTHFSTNSAYEHRKCYIYTDGAL